MRIATKKLYDLSVENIKQRFGLCKAWPFCQYNGCKECAKVMKKYLQTDEKNLVYLPVKNAKAAGGEN